MSNTESQPRERDYCALNLIEEQGMGLREIIWNPFYVPNKVHAKIIETPYGNEEAYLGTPLTPLNNTNEIEQPKT